MSFTPEDLEKGRWDTPFWSLTFLGIRLNPGQVRMADAYIKRDKSRWRAFYLWIMVAAGNRAGKTLALSVIILHSCFYRIGLRPPRDLTDPVEVGRWGRIPYHWWHFAVEQGPAEQVFAELVKILAGTHEAQPNGCPLVTQFEEAGAIATTDVKERGEYAMVTLHPELGGAVIHFRSTKAKAIGSLGQSMNGVSFDEAGLEPNLEFLMKEVLHLRRLSTGGPFLLISTPSASTSTDFEDLWYTGDPDDPFHEAHRFSMRISTRENIGYGVDPEDFDRLTSGMDSPWIAQNIDGKFIQASTVWFNAKSVDAAFHDELPIDVPPRPGAVYIHTLDPGLKDKTWSVVWEVMPSGRLRGVHIDRISGKQSTRSIVALGIRTHELYEQVDRDHPDGQAWIVTGVDTTALGGHMFRELLQERIPVVSIEFGGVTQVKRRMLSDAKSALDEDLVEFPADGFWKEFRRQLRNYKLADRKIEQDLVMNLAMATRLLRQVPRRADAPPTVLEWSRVQTPAADGRVDDGINSRSIRAALTRRRREHRMVVDG